MFAQQVSSTTPTCNICGGTEFKAFANRPNVQCSQCGSLERTRAIKAILDRHLQKKPGLSILHVAPEISLTNFFLSLPSVQYHAVDISPKSYRQKVRQMDLVVEAEKLPTRKYDVILHSHVMEHLIGNVTSVMFHLHRALADDGLHIFCIPIAKGYYEENLAPLTEEERLSRFGQCDHVRNFGIEDIHQTLGAIFHVSKDYSLRRRFPGIDFASYNIPEAHLDGINGHTIFLMRKGDIKLKDDVAARAPSAAA